MHVEDASPLRFELAAHAMLRLAALTLPRKMQFDFESGGRSTNPSECVVCCVVCSPQKVNRPKRQGGKGKKGKVKNRGSLFFMKPGLLFSMETTPVAVVEPCCPVV
jgi:hypothetical protein